jgi:hypothetical protein
VEQGEAIGGSPRRLPRLGRRSRKPPREEVSGPSSAEEPRRHSVEGRRSRGARS